MKKIFLSFLLFCTLSTSYAKIDIERIDPPFWWTGMQDRELQIMLYGKNIADCKIKIDYPGVTLTKAVSLDSKNYSFLYLSIAPDPTRQFRYSTEPKTRETKYPIHTQCKNHTGKKPERIRRNGRTLSDYARPFRRWRPVYKRHSVHAISFTRKSEQSRCPAWRGLKRYRRALGLYRRLRRNGHLAESGSRKRYARRVVSWICNNRLLSGRS